MDTILVAEEGGAYRCMGRAKSLFYTTGIIARVIAGLRQEEKVSALQKQHCFVSLSSSKRLLGPTLPTLSSAAAVYPFLFF